jgi:hypothetical protein
MAKKKADPKAKAKRQKVFLAVGGVFLLGLLVVQVPRTMKMLKPQEQSSSSSTSSAATSTTAGSTPLAPPTLGGATAAATGASGAPSAAASNATSADGVSDPSNPLPPNAGQLVSFSKFKSKDPFHQQIADCASDSTPSAPSGCASGSTPASSKSVSTTKPSSTNQPSTLIAHGPKPVPAQATKATISVNGTSRIVTVGSAFPADAPVFTLVSLMTSGAKIGIAGGAYEDGAATVTLMKGKTITLMNTADGRRYVLRLVSTA